MTDEKKPLYRTYKDRVFRMLYRDKTRLLELYNALNDTNYTNADDLTVTTLENAIYIKMKNDVSFVIDCNMCLYEHQSSFCPNMPLRGFLYFADLYKKYIKDIDLSVSKEIKIPAPQYIVLYNGTERKEEEFVQRLSDAFEGDRKGCIELEVRTININHGYNKELLSKCKTLADYSYFVAEVRRNLERMSLQEAVEQAVDTCIEQDVLKEFLLEQKAEVIAMSIYEYNEEYVRKVLLEDGIAEGELRQLISQICKKLKKGKTVELIAEELEEEQSRIQEICDVAMAYAPDFDCIAIGRAILKKWN